VYDCSYTRFEAKKQNYKKRNARTIARTCVSGPGVPVGVETRGWGVVGGRNELLGGRDAWCGFETRGWGRNKLGWSKDVLKGRNWS